MESFTEKDGLSGDYAWPVLEDREGNFWVGTSGGLDRFRASSMVLAEFPRGSHDFALVAGVPARRLRWVGKAGVPLERDPDGGENAWVCPKTGAKYIEKDTDTLVPAGEAKDNSSEIPDNESLMGAKH